MERTDNPVLDHMRGCKARTGNMPQHLPEIWVGCLHCYNDGRLVGDWFPAIDGEDLTPEDIHGQPVDSRHEELWVFDHQYIPERNEFQPSHGTRWGEIYEEVGDYQWPAFMAWIAAGAHTTDADNMPVVSDFEEQYKGEYLSWEEYADQLADDIGLLDEMPEHILGYFDWDAWRDDVKMDYTVVHNDDGNYFIFSDI